MQILKKDYLNPDNQLKCYPINMIKTEDSSVLHIPKYDLCFPGYIQGKKLEYKNGMFIKMAVVCFIWCVHVLLVCTLYIFVYCYGLMPKLISALGCSFIHLLLQDCLKSLHLEEGLIFITVYYCWCRYTQPVKWEVSLQKRAYFLPPNHCSLSIFR